MFERRLKILLALPIICGIIILARLYQLQVVHGEDYARLADAALVSPKQFLPPLRGRILDRSGRVLVSDQPAYDVAVHYGVLSMNDAYLLRLAGLLRKREPQWIAASDAALTLEIQRQITDMWTTLQKVSGQSMGQIRERRDGICRTVERLRRHISEARRKNGDDQPPEKVRLGEEDMFHAVLRDVSPQVRTQIELELGHLPFIKIEPSVRRVWAEDTASLCHVLGNLGQVSPEVIDNDPLAEDPLACYRAGDEAGISGAERLGEPILRGKRGFEERYLDGRLSSHAAPIDGLDLQLTIDLELQGRIAALLSAVVQEHPPSTGASCVVIDVPSREILALVSVPTYTRGQWQRDYAALRDDAAHLPLLFRAVQGEYQPGSIIKPVTLLAGFAHRLVNPIDTTFCDGQLIPGVDKWHCWTHWRGMPGHGAVNAEDAIKLSCNVYFYTLGQRIGAERMTTFYRAFIRGQTDDALAVQNTGLAEDRPGLLPTSQWMQQQRQRRFRQADGRNYAIGQGELLITPLQTANMFASIAEGRHRAPTLVTNDGRRRPPAAFTGISADTWRLVRRGLYRCVNEEGGTAFKYFHTDALEICGKTGSAECVARAVQQRYTFEVNEGGQSRERSIAAPTVEAAREILSLPYDTPCVKSEPLETFPAAGEHGTVPTHSWFAGFAPYRDPRLTVAVIVEYGGSGGRTAGPVARAVFDILQHCPQGYLPAQVGPSVHR
jgi:penicillin-binding protein 2